MRQHADKAARQTKAKACSTRRLEAFVVEQALSAVNQEVAQFEFS
jgi:hypothetical protein